ncbi:hypothetical protein MLGJGCBP_03003 [Rhodococcus sp. T7]|nr:hypothetical protein MLGJGCBP_03003 [Rhodococcus sp. T7]
MIRDREQLLLDGLDRLPCRGAACQGVVDIESGEIQPRRIHGGEPSDGAGQVRARDDLLLAAVAFEGEQRVRHSGAAFPPPGDQCQRDRGEQTVAHRPVECTRQRGEQGVGHRRRHVDRDGADGRVDVDHRIQRARTDQRIGAVEDLLPRREFARPGPHGLGQAVRPSPHRRSDFRQRGCESGLESARRRREVRHENPPGDTVDHEVVHHHEQSPDVVRDVEPDHAHHAGGGRVQVVGRSIEFGAGECGEAFSLHRFDRHPADVPRYRTRRQHVHTVRGHPRPEHVVPVQYRLDGADEHLVSETGGGGQQQRL